jgi:hypothetical protein
VLFEDKINLLLCAIKTLLLQFYVKMRLISTKDLDHLQLAGPFVDADTPPYAILSHTWGKPEDEVSFQDMANILAYKHKTGFKKLRSFCKQAKRKGYEYAWADTVCIDKNSSSELSEAINSMYKWYERAQVCCVHLEDLFSDVTPPTQTELAKCRWFTRGWTLQELIAPADIIFFNKDWKKIGTKNDFITEIANITGVDKSTLSGLSFKRASIARRMSWVSKRKTSRPEDIAYCLLGISV